MLLKEGSVVKGRVTGIKEYGAFVKVKEYDGLIHISEFSDQFVKSIKDIVSIGDVVELKVLEVDETNKRLRLSYKATNAIISRILKYAKLDIGFTSLEEAFEDWIKAGYEKLDKK